MPEPKPVADASTDASTEDAAVFQPPPKGTPEYDAWLDGPRPEAGRGRGQWLRARQLRGNAAKAERNAANGVAEPSERREAHGDEAAAIAEADVATLDAIIGSSKSLASDRIRAIEAKQRILNREQAEAQASAHGPLLALRDALLAVPEAQRADALSALLVVE